MTNLKYTLPFALLALCACGEEDTTDTATIGIGGQDTAVNVVGSDDEAESFAAACGSAAGFDPQMYPAIVGCPVQAEPPPCDGTLTFETEFGEAACVHLVTAHCGDAGSIDTIEIVFEGGIPVGKTVTQLRDGAVACVYVHEAPASLQCPDQSTQIDPTWLCDGADDCPSGVDETGC